MLTVIDQFGGQSHLTKPRVGFRGCDVATALNRVIGHTATPLLIMVNHDTEFTSKTLEDWAYRRGMKLDFTHPVKPTEGWNIESFNGR